MGIKRLDNRPRTELSQEQKVAFALLAFLGLGGLIFGFRSFGSSLTRPIQQQLVDNFTGEQYLSPEQKLSKERENQKKVDTDLDGLNDYDELYVYRSSPYLKDTDSDNIDDKTEVYAAQDPNCPEGRTCGAEQQSESVASTKQQDVENLLQVFVDPEGALEAGATAINSKEDANAFFNGLTTEQLRQALLKSGIPKAQLDQIDDVTLQSYFSGAIKDLETAQKEAEAKKKAEASGQASTSAEVPPTTTTPPSGSGSPTTQP